MPSSHKRYLYFVILILISFNANAQKNYERIPEELKKNANAVIRYSNSEFEVQSINRAKFTIKYAITILNRNGDKFANLYVYYDKFINVSNIKGMVYDYRGVLIKKVKSKDIIDQSITSGGTFYDDSRVKYVEVFQKKYPYTVEYEYTLNYSGFINIPKWNPVIDYDISVQKSEYKIKADSTYAFHYTAVNLNEEAFITRESKTKSYLWNLNNLPAIKEEPYNPCFSDFSPAIYFAPDKFYYDGYKGNQSSWKEYGKWAYKLLEGRDEISEKTKLEIQKLVRDIKNPVEKTKAIYEYMQSKTRYVSIQLGIGGFQPFSALEVDQQGYGDCKALCNYTKALLKVADIKSIYSEVYGGSYKKKFMFDFSGINQTNHIILCVPIKQDTIWLECTDQEQAFGYLGSFTDDRYAVLITSDGGKLAKTSSYSQDDNLQSRTIKCHIDENGNAETNIETSYKAIQYDNISNQFRHSREVQKKNIYKTLKLNNFEIAKFNYIQTKDIIPVAIENLTLNIKNYASVSGKRMFLPLNMMNKHTYIPKKIEERKSDILFNYAFSDFDTIIYYLPKNYKIEYISDTCELKSQYGEYKSYIMKNDTSLTYIRINKRNEGRFPAEKYEDLIKYYKDIRKADNLKAILIKK